MGVVVIVVVVVIIVVVVVVAAAAAAAAAVVVGVVVVVVVILIIIRAHSSWMEKKDASAGNRTRAARGLLPFGMAGEHSTTEPPMRCVKGRDFLIHIHTNMEK